MQEIQEIAQSVAQRYGVELTFDEHDTCVFEHEDEFEIMVAQRDNGRFLAIVADLGMMMPEDPAKFMAELLHQNQTGTLAGPFSFAMDRDISELRLVRVVETHGMTAERFMANLNAIVEVRAKVLPIVQSAQTSGEPFQSKSKQADTPQEAQKSFPVMRA